MSGTFESLESRRMLSSATLDDGVLRVRGENDFHEAVVLKLVSDGERLNVSIDGENFGNFRMSAIDRVSVNTKTGPDEITIDESGGRIRDKLIILDGGGGNDTITAGRDRIKIFGRDGNDRIIGRGYIDGGEGNDTIDGSSSKDYIFAGAGRDIVDAEEGNDVVFGGDGNDRLEGDEGKDLVFGDAGDDTITGGDGDDRLFGNAGIDLLEGEAGDDTLYGGRHEDVLRGGDGGSDTKVGGEYADLEALVQNLINKARAYVS